MKIRHLGGFIPSQPRRHVGVRAGFTVAELVVIIGIMALVLTLTYASFANLGKREVLDKEALQVVSILNEARSLTLASEGASQYGVHFETAQVVLFRGFSYSSTDPQNKTVPLHDRVVISAINLTGGGSEVVFERLTGTTGESGTTTLSLKSDAGQTKSVVIFATGITEVK
ncbi:hypothetical protein EPN83_01235 [Patescibacteria group bacterium]|nr:MAG: hypothetical protein EPN83_01235 [Patescibacteria group bacterium]